MVKNKTNKHYRIYSNRRTLSNKCTLPNRCTPLEGVETIDAHSPIDAQCGNWNTEEQFSMQTTGIIEPKPQNEVDAGDQSDTSVEFL